MNWDAIGAIGELIGALAVVITLAYLAVQIRQNSKALHSSTRFEIAKTQMDINFLLAQNPDLAVASYGILQGKEGISEKDQLAAGQFISGMFRTFENQFYAYREGNFSEGVWGGYRRNIAWNAGQPKFLEFWKERRPLFSEDFAEFVDSLAISEEGNF